MIVVDTDVLSEPLRVAPGARVVERMRAQADAAVTAVSVAELLTGAYRRPHGVRREQLLSAIERVLAGPEILAVDASAAREYASMQESRRAEGRPLPIEDGMIVAIARQRRRGRDAEHGRLRGSRGGAGRSLGRVTIVGLPSGRASEGWRVFAGGDESHDRGWSVEVAPTGGRGPLEDSMPELAHAPRGVVLADVMSATEVA